MSTKRPAEVVVPASLGARAPVDGRAKRIRFGDDGEVEEEQLPEAKVFSTGREVPAWHLVQQEAAIEAPAAAAAAKAAAKKDMYRNKRDDRAGAAAGAGGGDGDGDGAPNRATAKKEKIVPQVPKLSEAERKALQKQRRRVDRLKSEATILKAKHAPATPEPSAADASPDTSLEAIAAAAAAATTRDVDADETPDTNTAALDGGADDADAAADTAAQKKTKKKAKKAKGKTAAKPAAGGAASDESEASKGKQAALEYLDMFTNNRKMWKFQKVRQIWILRNMYYPSLMSDAQFTDTLKYLANMSDKAKSETIAEAQQIIEQIKKIKTAAKAIGDDGAEADKTAASKGDLDLDPDVAAAADPTYKRAKKLIKKLGGKE